MVILCLKHQLWPQQLAVDTVCIWPLNGFQRLKSLAPGLRRARAEQPQRILGPRWFRPQRRSKEAIVLHARRKWDLKDVWFRRRKCHHASQLLEVLLLKCTVPLAASKQGFGAGCWQKKGQLIEELVAL